MARRPIAQLFGVDEEYAKGIDTPLPEPLPEPKKTRNTPAQKVVSSRSQAIKHVDQEREKPAPAAKIQEEPAPKPNASEQPLKEEGEGATLQVAFHLRPLERHKADLIDLNQKGYRMDAMLKLAMKNMRAAFKPEAEYVEPTHEKLWMDHKVRMMIRVNPALPAALSEQAGDLGTMFPSHLLAGQVQPKWIAALDAVIAKLKRSI